MDIGASFAPADYESMYPKIPAPAFARVFSAPGRGLPNLDGPAVAGLPPGTTPWISHKDPIEPEQGITDMWRQLAHRYPADRIRWTYHHEAAPKDRAWREEYHAYWSRLRVAADAFPHIELVQIQSNYAMRWRADTDWSDWIIPGVSLGFDCYPLAGYDYEPPESMFGLLIEAASRFRCPSWGVPELGADRRTNPRGDWLIECARYLDRRGAGYLGLWGKSDSKGSWEPTDEPTIAAWRKIISHDLDVAPSERRQRHAPDVHGVSGSAQ